MTTASTSSSSSFCSSHPGIHGLYHSFVNSAFVNSAKKIVEIAHIVAVEGFANFRHVTPCAISWWAHDLFNPKMVSFSFPFTVEKTKSTATLYLYQPLDIKENEKCAPVLLLHGDYGHPFTLHHLAKIALKNHSGPVFNLYIPNIHHDEHFSEQGSLIDVIVMRIKKMVEDKGGIFEGILAAGHSKGGMLLLERQFSPESAGGPILRTFAAGAPIGNEESHFEEPLKTILRELYRKIQKYTERKFFQVFGENDWVAPREWIAVRPEEHCYRVPGMHLSGLYTKQTEELFGEFLKL